MASTPINAANALPGEPPGEGATRQYGAAGTAGRAAALVGGALGLAAVVLLLGGFALRRRRAR
jgi:hypothetical protein